MHGRWVAALLVLASCATGERREPSVAAHRAEAARELQAAREEGTAGSPGPAIAPSGVAAPASGSPILDLLATESRAERHLRHAAEHERAAAELERFEAEACGEVAPPERAACPLLSGVRTVEDVADGVRLHFTDGSDVDSLASRMRCHLAFARARGWDPAFACALYLRGVSVRAAPGIIDLLGDSRTVVRALQGRVRGELH